MSTIPQNSINFANSLELQDQYDPSITDQKFHEKEKIPKIAKENISHGIPAPISSLDLNNVKLCQIPAKHQFASLKEAFKSLMGNAYDPRDVIDQWVYAVLGESFRGNNESLNKYLSYLKNAHPENQEALISTAYTLAKQMGHETLCQQLLLNHEKTISFSSKLLQLDKTKEVHTNLIDVLAKIDQNQRPYQIPWYLLSPAPTLGLCIVSLGGAVGLGLSLFSPQKLIISAAAVVVPLFLATAAAVKSLDLAIDESFNLDKRNIACLNIVKINIQRGSIENAFDTIQHMTFASPADEALNLIGKKAIAEGNPSLAERAAKKMTFAANADNLWGKCVTWYLSTEGNTEKALNVVQHMTFAANADETLSCIGKKAIAEGNPSLAERAAKKMTFAANADNLWGKCVTWYLSTEGNTEKALNVVQHMTFAANADETLSCIGKKAIAEGNPSLAERAAKKMTFASNADNLWKKIQQARN